MYNVMIGDVMVYDRDLIKILQFAVQGIRAEKALARDLTEEQGEELEALAEKAKQAESRLIKEFCLE